MSSTQEITQYNYTIYWTDPYSSANFTFTVSGTSSFGDAEAFALIEGIKAAFPSALSVGGGVSKNAATSVSYTTDLATTPPSFT